MYLSKRKKKTNEIVLETHQRLSWTQNRKSRLNPRQIQPRQVYISPYASVRLFSPKGFPPTCSYLCDSYSLFFSLFAGFQLCLLWGWFPLFFQFLLFLFMAFFGFLHFIVFFTVVTIFFLHGFSLFLLDFHQIFCFHSSFFYFFLSRFSSVFPISLFPFFSVFNTHSPFFVYIRTFFIYMFKRNTWLWIYWILLFLCLLFPYQIKYLVYI